MQAHASPRISHTTAETLMARRRELTRALHRAWQRGDREAVAELAREQRELTAWLERQAGTANAAHDTLAPRAA